MKMKKVAVLISGSGSNLQAFIDTLPAYQIKISVVISNKADVQGVQRAQKANIPTYVIPQNQYATREDFDKAMVKVIDKYQVDFVLLAGFMRILTDEFVNHYYGKLINIHPSLLPKYKGLHTHQRAIEAGDAYAGASIHFVVSELDAGPILAQVKVPIDVNDDADSLAKKVNQQEIRLYPVIVKWLCEDKLKLVDNQVMFGKYTLSEAGLPFTPYELRD
jgi:phosphoribosylglycinamide formyltransferase-1